MQSQYLSRPCEPSSGGARSLDGFSRSGGRGCRIFGHHRGIPGSTSSAVLFDLDGVLVDSRGPITGCINHALEAHGLAPQPPSARPEVHRAAAGARVRGADREAGPLLARHRVRQRLPRPLYRSLAARDDRCARDGGRVAKLARRHRLAVATSKPLVYAEPLLETLGLRPFFDFCAGPDLSASGEDKSVTIAGALARIDRAAAVMVGDRSFDIVGAHRCAVRAIAVTWGIGSLEGSIVSPRRVRRASRGATRRDHRAARGEAIRMTGNSGVPVRGVP